LEYSRCVIDYVQQPHAERGATSSS
jgi:hypothetical protein